jgi:hypothetical protein
MFIDTANANSRSVRPQISISPRRTSPYNESSTPLLVPFVGQEPPPPTYLEATTPGLFSSRLSDDQGARLLADGEREETDAADKEDKYRRKGLRAECASRRWIRWVPAIAFIIILAAMLIAMAAAVSVRGAKHVGYTSLMGVSLILIHSVGVSDRSEDTSTISFSREAGATNLTAAF